MSGQGTAKAGEHKAATTPDPLDGGPNRVLSGGGSCLTLIETNHYPVRVSEWIPLQRVNERYGGQLPFAPGHGTAGSSRVSKT